MRYTDIKLHLKPYSIVARRRTTINHAFAASVAPHDEFDDERVRDALKLLGQDPDCLVMCAYCGTAAETWDHVFATVEKTQFSGYGHRLGNLLPCCKPCNSRKGNKDWRVFLKLLGLPENLRKERESRIAAYLDRYRVVDVIPEHLQEYQELMRLRLQVLEIFQRADALASAIRAKAKSEKT
jgi:5-methylcytosine-specific restriction endonuclease McrA